MVVREALGSVVRRLPYSGYLPRSILGHEDDYNQDELAALNYTTTRERSPKDTIHDRILSNRAEKMNNDNSDEALMELTCLNYCDTFDDSSIEISPINRLKYYQSINKVKSDHSDASETLVPSTSNLNVSFGAGNTYRRNKLTPVEESAEDREIKALRIEAYLNEQNKKFDELVNKNLDKVLQDTSGDFKKNIIGFFDVFDYSLQDKVMDVSNIIGIACNSALNLMHLNRDRSKISDEGLDLESVTEENGDLAGKQFDKIANAVENKSAVDSLLVSLDYETKVELFNLLKEELYVNEGNVFPKQEDDPYLSNDASPGSNNSDLLIDKIQMCVLISIKLIFTGIKLTVPLGKLLYQKFKNDQMFIVNNKNANKFLMFIIKLMKLLESQLNNEKVLNFHYGYEGDSSESRLQLSLLHNENLFVRDTADLPSSSQSNDTSWKSAIMEYILFKYMSGPNVNVKRSDPKYSKFFAHPRSAPVSSSSSHSFNKSANNDSATTYTNLRDPLSVLKVAEQFLDEF